MTDLPAPGDFGGTCLVGACRLDADLLSPTSTFLGTRNEGSFLYGTWRDDDGNLLRALRGVTGGASQLRFVFRAEGVRQLERDVDAEHGLSVGAVDLLRDGESATFASVASADPGFRYRQEPTGCSWDDGAAIAVTGRACGPAMQWFNTWDGGACLSISAKYRSTGRVLGRAVEGFVGHEIHYFSEGANWLDSPYGRGREICWQQIANEYDDGTIVVGTLAYGADGWGFAMLHDDRNGFRSSTDVRAEATVRASGCPEAITYRFLDETWTWRIDPQGERAPIMPGSPLIGADGVCTREGDRRTPRVSMGNSDWWLDGRADPIIRTAPPG